MDALVGKHVHLEPLATSHVDALAMPRELRAKNHMKIISLAPEVL